MKYVLLFCGSEADGVAFQAMSAEAQQALFAQAVAWFDKYASKIRDSQELQGPEACTTVRFAAPGRDPVVSDGPFIEAKEAIGGYAHIEVEDLDEALRMARDWQCGGAIEIHPAVIR